MRQRMIKPTFAGGELADDLSGRVDISRYSTSVQKAENFFITRFGAASNRPGTEYIGATPWPITRLVPFEFSVRQTYALEFSGREVTYWDDFSSTIMNPAWTASTEDWIFGGGLTSVQLASNGQSNITRTVGGVGVTPQNGAFEYSGTMTYDDFPTGSATDVWNHDQFVKMIFAFGEVLEIGFDNGSDYSGPAYTGYRIKRTGSSDVYIDSTDFSDVGWSITKSGTTVTAKIGGVEYPMTVVDTPSVSYSFSLYSVIQGTTTEYGKAEFSGIQEGTIPSDIYAKTDNVMRVVKDGAVVLKDLTESAGQWTASGSEYYYNVGDLEGAVDVYEGTTLMTEGTAGALAEGEWAWSTGTVYVRLTGGGDPDSGATADVFVDYQLASGLYEYVLDEMTYAQSKDTLFLAGQFFPKQLVRSADDSWTISDVEFLPTPTIPIDVYTKLTGFTATDRQVLYKFATLSDTGIESLPTETLTVDLQLTWPTAGRVDLYMRNITDGLESSPVFKWTSTPSAANEFYCELIGGGDPSLSEPSNVYEDKVEMTEGTLGSLAIGEWAYGDNDSLGYNTIYCRIAASADPNTKVVGYITYKLSTDVQWRVYKNYRGDWGWLGDVDKPFFLDDNIEPLVNVAPKEDHTPFDADDADTWPYAVGFFQQRLYYARTNDQPQTTFGSRLGDFGNHTISRPLSSEDSIEASLVSGGRVDEIRHLIPIDKLIVLTTGSEWTFTHGANSDAITPFSIAYNQQGYAGCSTTVQPLAIDKEALFIQRDGKDIRSMRFRLEDENYLGEILTYFVPHLFEGRTIVDWCYQQHPNNLIWIVLSDGKMLSMTYIPEQQMIALTRHYTDGDVKSCASITTQGEDKVYFTVERTIEGSVTTYLETLSTRDFGENVRDAKFLDSALSYNPKLTITNVVPTATETTVTVVAHGYSNGDYVLLDNVLGITATGDNDDYATFNDKYYKVAGVTTDTFELTDLDDVALTTTAFEGTYIKDGNSWKCTNTVSGLEHLEGETVGVLADGSVEPGPFVVTGGSITLGTTDPGFGVVHVGLPYTCDLQTLRLESQGEGSIQGLSKRIIKVKTRFKDSSGGKMGQDTGDVNTIKWRQYEDWLSPNALTTGDVEHELDSDWDDDGVFLFRQEDPLPSTVLMYIIDYEVGDK